MGNQLQLTSKALTEAPNLKAMFELEAVRSNAIVNYVKTSGETDKMAAMKYERERVLLMKALMDNPELEKCDRNTVYFSWIEMFAAGGTLADGCSYMVPFKGRCTWLPGWKQRLNQIDLMPGVEYVQAPIVVYNCDDFQIELGENPKIVKHIPKTGAGKDPGDVITHVYMFVEENGRKKLFVRERHQVIATRDRYSPKFKAWKSRGGKTLVEDGGFVHAKWDNGNVIDLPFWLISYDANKSAVDNPDAFKKTLVKKVYEDMPNKTGRMKAIDKILNARPDPEEGTDEVIDYGMDKVDTSSGEIIESAHTEVEQPKPTNTVAPLINTEAF